MCWTIVEEAEQRRLERILHLDADPGRQLMMQRMTLPFYKNGVLLRLQDRDGAAYAVEAGPGHRPAFVGLDGDVDALRVANQLAGLNLTIDTVAFYVHFFCGFLRGDGGQPFVLVSELPGYTVQGAVPQSLAVMVAAPEDLPGYFVVKGYTVYAGELSLAVYLVHPDGTVDMVHSELIGPLVRLQ